MGVAGTRVTAVTRHRQIAGTSGTDWIWGSETEPRPERTLCCSCASGLPRLARQPLRAWGGGPEGRAQRPSSQIKSTLSREFCNPQQRMLTSWLLVAEGRPVPMSWLVPNTSWSASGQVGSAPLPCLPWLGRWAAGWLTQRVLGPRVALPVPPSPGWAESPAGSCSLAGLQPLTGVLGDPGEIQSKEPERGF